MAIKHPLTSLIILICLKYCLAASTGPKSVTRNAPTTQKPLLEKFARFDEFDWDLCKRVYNATRDNVLISPVSLKLVLVILSEGAGGNTANEIDRVLQVSPKDKVALRNKFEQILDTLERQSHNKEYILRSGSSAFIDEAIRPHPEFKGHLRRYRSDITQVSFKHPKEVVNQVNLWAKTVTGGFVEKFLTTDDVSEDEILLMLNVLFFKGLWLKPFEPKRTELRLFHVNSTYSVKTPFMNMFDEFYHLNATELDAQILKLPYLGEQYAMYIILPNQKDGLSELMGKLDLQKLRAVFTRLTEAKVGVSLPKFSFDSHTFMKPFLQQLGLKDLFSDKANLSRIAENPPHELFVSNILQRTGIEVEEAGSTAYVITEAHLANKFGDSYTEFNADHPFLFTIEHDTGKIPVFTGKFANPSNKFSEVEVTPAPTPAPAMTEPPHSTPLLPSRVDPSPGSGNSMGSSENAAPTTTEDASSVPVELPQAEGAYHTTPAPSYAAYAPGVDERPVISSDVQHEFLQDSFFDTRLLQKLYSPGNRENIIVSPVSVKMTLAILLEGAGRNTAAEMERVLGLPQNIAQLRGQLSKFQHSLQRESADSSVHSANGMFLSQNLKVAPHYKSVITDDYQAGVLPVDFKEPNRASSIVNEWVDRNTQGVIDTLVSPADITAELKMLLVNTMYFKGKWDLGFLPNNTVMGCFTPFDGKCTKVPMMETSSLFNYTQAPSLSAQVMELPYKDSRYSLVLMLPHGHDKESFRKLMKDLPEHQLKTVLSTMRPKKVFVSIPRFAIQHTSNLVPVLQQLGVKDVFSKRADLTGILSNGAELVVDKIVQKAKIELDEQGTVAAAATGTFVIPLSSSISTFDADRPFLFFLRDRESGAILFEGILSDPETFTNNTQVMESKIGSQSDRSPVSTPNPGRYKPAQIVPLSNEGQLMSTFTNKTQHGYSSLTGQSNPNQVSNTIAPNYPEPSGNENSGSFNFNVNRIQGSQGGSYGAPSVVHSSWNGQTSATPTDQYEKANPEDVFRFGISDAEKVDNLLTFLKRRGDVPSKDLSTVYNWRNQAARDNSPDLTRKTVTVYFYH